MAEMAPDSHERHERRRDEDTSYGSKNEDTDTTKNPQTNSLHTQTHTKDQRLREEERSLLAKLHQMAGDMSPVSAPRSATLLIPDPREIDATELVDRSQPLITDSLQEISLTEGEQPLANHRGQNPKGEEDV